MKHFIDDQMIFLCQVNCLVIVLGTLFLLILTNSQARGDGTLEVSCR